MTFFLLCLWKRYYYYLTNGIQKDMIAPEDEEVMVRIYKLIPKVLLATPALEPLQVALRTEKERDYYWSLMKSIGKAGLVGTELLWRALPFLCARCFAVVVMRQPENISSEEEWFIFISWLQGSGDMVSCPYCFWVVMAQNIPAGACGAICVLLSSSHSASRESEKAHVCANRFLPLAFILSRLPSY